MFIANHELVRQPPIHFIVSLRIIRYFTHKASVTSVNAEANVLGADWLMSVFVNELALPMYAVKVSACVRQCRRL